MLSFCCFIVTNNWKSLKVFHIFSSQSSNGDYEDREFSWQHRHSQSSSSSSFHGRRQQNFHNNNKTRANFGDITAPLLGLSWIVTLRDVLGIEKVQLDKDPIKDKIKQSLLHRRHNRYTEAINVILVVET